MRYKVIKAGVTQRQDDGVPTEVRVGETIELTPEAAVHLMSEGYIESAEDAKETTRKKAKVRH